MCTTIFLYIKSGENWYAKKMDKLQVLSFILTPFCRRCPFLRIVTGSFLCSEFCYTFGPLTLTQLDFFVKSHHVQVT
ncbi:hypothetical protein Hanom_Chr08g00749201 [Helianthus anomalus]